MTVKGIKYIVAMAVLALACAGFLAGCPPLGFDEDPSG